MFKYFHLPHPPAAAAAAAAAAPPAAAAAAAAAAPICRRCLPGIEAVLTETPSNCQN